MRSTQRLSSLCQILTNTYAIKTTAPKARVINSANQGCSLTKWVETAIIAVGIPRAAANANTSVDNQLFWRGELLIVILFSQIHAQHQRPNIKLEIRTIGH